jgi:hypothetical protein
MERTVARLHPVDGGFVRADLPLVPDHALVDASGEGEVFLIEQVVEPIASRA